MKKIYLAVICLICLTSLTACHIPILNKEVTLPFFEKKPATAVKMMINKMADVKTMEFEGKFDMNLHIDMTSLMKMGALKEKYASLFLTNQTKVLGITSMPDFDAMGISREEDMLNDDFDDIYEPAPLSQMPFFGKEPIDITLFLDTSGKIDQTSKKNIKQEVDMDIELDMGIFNFETSIETKILDNKTYLKIHELPLTFLPQDIMKEVEKYINEITNKWWLIDPEEIMDKQKEAMEMFGGMGMMPIGEMFDFEKQQEQMQELQEKLVASLKKYNVIKVDERLRDEKIDGKKCYHYKVSINKKELRNFVDEAIEIYFDYMEDQFSDMMPEIKDEIMKSKEEMTDSKEYQEAMDGFMKSITKANGEMWIDKKDFYLRKSDFKMTFDFSKFAPDEVVISEDALTLKINSEMNYSNFNQKMNIAEPLESESLVDYLWSLAVESMEKAKVNSRDAKRVSDVKQMQTALELYYNDNEKYPESITDTHDYLFTIPTNPIPEKGDCPEDFDYIYQVKEDGEGYDLYFCLEENTGSLGSGYGVAKMTGIESFDGDPMEVISPIVEESTEPVDTDNDGLTDDQEELYGTDINNSDTDGDGYIDGDEVKNGYNPNGEGKL